MATFILPLFIFGVSLMFSSSEGFNQNKSNDLQQSVYEKIDKIASEFRFRFRSLKASELTSRQYTGSVCTSDFDCESPRLCYYVGDDDDSDWDLCQGRSDCRCVSRLYLSCNTSDDCLEMDRCYTLGDNSLCISCLLSVNENATAVDSGNCGSTPSESAQPEPVESDDPPPSTVSPRPTTESTTRQPLTPVPQGSPPGSPIPDSSVCISVDALMHMHPSTLVFASHRRASVLCDHFQNCATPGHMVVFKQKPMSMKNYCAQTGIVCVKRVKLVNSPKMKLGLRINSRSKHLKFTALAAAKETWVETAALKLVLNLGA